MNSAGRMPVHSAPDYYARGLALCPRLVPPRPMRVRSDPHRIAALIARRTNLSYQAILALLDAPDDPSDTARLDH